MAGKELAKKAEILKNLAIVSSSQQDNDAALGYAESALAIYEKLGDKQNVFRVHMMIQLLYMSGAWDGAKEDKALKHLEAIAALVEKDPDDMEKGAVYQRTAHLYLHRGQPNTALAWTQRAADVFARLGMPMGTRLKAASSLGTALTYTGLIDEGIAYNENIWDPVVKKGSPLPLAMLSQQLTLSLALVRDIPRARTWGEKALPETAKAGLIFEGFLRRPLALVYALSGEVTKAHEACQAAQTLESKTLVGCHFEDTAGIGLHYLHQGEWDKAREYLERAMGAHQNRNNLAAVSACSFTLGNLNLEEGNSPKAEELLLKSLEICRNGGNILFELWVLPVLAELYLKIGQADKAAEYVNRGFELMKPDQNWYGLPASMHLARGMLLTARRDWDAAIESFDKAIKINRQYQLPWDEAKTLYQIGLMYLARGGKGDRDKAHKNLDEALAIFQNVGAKKDAEKVLRKKEMLKA
ncbi:MAG: tetratricopeptide repeat protein [Dehalococcoidia bacterium]|nr:tetratricopeptide repeat protein [Dehalococcoidia bacterium]MDH4366888.1 tetratricopeptide repeat protein [Dehalococcoidia bacterium]